MVKKVIGKPIPKVVPKKIVVEKRVEKDASVVKEVEKDASVVKEVVEKVVHKKMTAKEREELLIENFVGLQHAMTNLSIKFGSLSDNISELLRVFETAAKAFSQGGKVDDSDMLKKIDALLTQNKTIAKGLVLMEGKLRGRAESPPTPTSYERLRPKPLPEL